MRLAKALMTMATGLHALLCALPLLCVVNLYAMAVRAAILLGRWPRGYYYHDDAVDHIGQGDLLYKSLYHSMGWLVVAAFLSVPFWLMLTICLRGRYSLAGRWGRVALYGIGLLACVAVVVFDPGDCFEWFMD